MRTVKLLFLFLIALASAALAAQNASILSPNQGHLSFPSLTSNPDAAYAFTSFNTQPGRFDRNADGRVDLIIADRNGDGSGDYWATDRNFDGILDDYQYDRNLDGRIDQWEYDFNGDGISDKIYVDADGNGQPDMYADMNPVTRNYTWYGNMRDVFGAGKSALPGVSSAKRLASGKAAFSM